MFEKNNEKIIVKLNLNRHKTVIITDCIFHNERKVFVTVNFQDKRKMDFADHLWLLFIDQLQLEVFVFAINFLEIYKIL